MASAFGHAALAISLGTPLYDVKDKLKIRIAGVISSTIPDLDVILHYMSVPYGSLFGHRGFSHGLFFACLWSAGVYYIFFRGSRPKNQNLGIMVYLFLCTASHGVLDAMTNGGRGIGFFSPFDGYRYFFPWRFIEVSPMSISRFFSSWGISVLWNEFLVIMIPSICLGIILFQVKKQLLNKV